MNKLLILLMILLYSCSSPVFRNDVKFPDDITFEDFRVQLEEYSRNNPYPNIDD